MAGWSSIHRTVFRGWRAHAGRMPHLFQEFVIICAGQKARGRYLLVAGAAVKCFYLNRAHDSQMPGWPKIRRTVGLKLGGVGRLKEFQMQ